jgi:hypothetical protein
VAHATVPSRDRTISLGSVSSHASPHSSRVVCCLHWHEPNRYRLMDDSAANEHPSNKEHAVMLLSSAIAANVIRRFKSTCRSFSKRMTAMTIMHEPHVVGNHLD